MILRRVTEHVTEQHWAAVVIELVVVILGVFIGLQVDNWNQGRRDRERERIYLEGIAVELAESIDSIDDSINLTKERMALDEFLIAAATDSELVRANPGRFIYAVTRGGYTFSPTIHGFTFEEIKSAGDLGIIRDQSLAMDLMKFYANVQDHSQWEYIRAFNQSEYIRRSAGILTAPQLMSIPASSHVVPMVDVGDTMAAYGRMLDRPDFIEWVPTILFFRGGDLTSSTRWRETAMDLRARILAQPGVGG